jgi:hypothetical protein
MSHAPGGESMLVAATELDGESVVGYFDVNFPARDRGEYRFMWYDGRIRTLQIRIVRDAPVNIDATMASYDVASGFVIVKTD